MRFATTMLGSLMLASPAVAQDGVARAAASVTAGDVRNRIGILAHDSLLGRDTPSPGLDKAARYIAAEFRRFGLRPGGEDGTFLQHYAIERVRIDTVASRVQAPRGPRLRFPEDAAQLSEAWAPRGVSGPTLLVAGHTGDPAAILADAPVERAVVVLVAGGGGDATLRRTLFAILRREPAAVLVAVDVPERTWNGIAAQQLRAKERVASDDAGGDPVVYVRAARLASMLAANGVDATALRDTTAQTLRFDSASEVRLTLTIAPTVLHRDTAPNVVGVLPGSDPALRDEHVVFSAHMDHVGVGRPVNGDSIYNGADDDASGTAAILELAEAYAGLPNRPRRSMIFLTVSGEEKGLWGSDYFAEHAPVPIERIVTNLNIDMIGRNWRDTVVAIGREHSDLGATLARVNTAHPELGMRIIDDPWPQERFYYRSDHYNFARRGVPVLFFFTGTHEDYHRPGDHVEKIDAEKEARIVKLIFFLGLEVANAADRPKWDPRSYEQIVGSSR